MIALNAVVEPMLMRPRRRLTTVTSTTARVGMAKPLETRAKYPEKGRPLSLAKAQVWREAEAISPHVAAIEIVIMTEVMAVAPRVDSVAP